MRQRLSHLAPEEIAGGVLLVAALLAVVLHPSAIGRIFESPYATPAPESPGRAIVTNEATPAPTARIETTPRLADPVPLFLVAPPRRVVGPDGRTTFVFDRAGRPLQAGNDICAEAARSGQLVVCVPISPLFATPVPAPSR